MKLTEIIKISMSVLVVMLIGSKSSANSDNFPYKVCKPISYGAANSDDITVHYNGQKGLQVNYSSKTNHYGANVNLTFDIYNSINTEKLFSVNAAVSSDYWNIISFYKKLELKVNTQTHIGALKLETPESVNQKKSVLEVSVVCKK